MGLGICNIVGSFRPFSVTEEKFKPDLQAGQMLSLIQTSTEKLIKLITEELN